MAQNKSQLHINEEKWLNKFAEAGGVIVVRKPRRTDGQLETGAGGGTTKLLLNVKADPYPPPLPRSVEHYSQTFCVSFYGW